MARVLLFAVVLVLSSISGLSQFNIRTSGTYTGVGGAFDKRTIKGPVGFEVFSIDPDLSAEEYTFQLYVKDGSETRTLQFQSGTQWWLWIDLLNLPALPEPQLVVTLRVRHRYSGVAYNVSKVFPIRFIDPIAELGQLKWGSQWETQTNLDPLIIGQEQGRLYYFGKFPNTARSATFAIIGSRGDTLNFTQSTFGATKYTMIDTAYKKKWPGGCTLRGRVFYDNGPADGYVIERTIPDSIPAPMIDASAGFGPFRRGVDAQNTFVAKGLGPLCDSIQWILQYDTDAGQLRTIVNSKRPYDRSADTAVFSYNMRDIGQNAKLIVRASFGPFVPPSQSVVHLTVDRPQPVFRSSFATPRSPGATSIDTVVIDSLPPRILNLTMILSDQSGAVIAQTTVKREAPTYIRSAKLTFKASDLRLGTYVVRVRALNDFKDDAPDFFFGFDVRDTSKFFLIADSWGPFTRGDSATISPAVTDVRPYKGLDGWDKIYGRFVLVDTLNPTVPLRTSPEIDLSAVKSRDSVIYWPDDSYVHGKPIEGRARILTTDLPITAQVRFERVINYTGRPVYDNQLEHRVFMVAPPGELSTSPRLDSTITITRNTPLTLRLSKIVPEAKAVRFRLFGTKDPEPVIERLIQLSPGQTSASVTVDAGILPVNSKLITSVATSLGEDYGSELRRTVNTTVDTLAMIAVPPIDTLRLDWDVDPTTRLIKGVVRLLPTLKFSKIPAQTRTIVLLSYSDVGEVLDSLSIGVPYRNKYDSTLYITTQFPFRTFNVAALKIKYLSDGGPIEGVQYTKSIVSLTQPMEAVVQKMDVTTKPPSIDKSEIRQGSNDLVSLALRWRVRTSSSENSLGYASSLQVDSVRMTIRDCAGNLIDEQLVRPIPPGTNSGTVIDTLYSVRRLPLSTDRVEYRMYSKSMTLPVDGLTFSTAFTLRTNPVLSIPLGTSYPSYRVRDTVAGTLIQRTYITNVDGITSIDSTAIVDRSNMRVHVFPQLRAVNDTMWLPEFDFTRLNPDQGPYRVIGLVRTRTCLQDRTRLDTLAVLDAPRVFNNPSSKNWIYSSMGWGPFQQGRAPSTLIVANFDPAAFIERRSTVDDSLAVSIVGFSRAFNSVFTKDVPTGFHYPNDVSLPSSARVRAMIDLNPFDPSSSIALHVKWIKKSTAGASVWRDTMYYFPVRMLEFPDQEILADTAGYEQSVSAGTTGTSAMPSYYDFRMVPQSSTIDRLTFSMQSSTENRLDTTDIAWQSRDVAAKTSVFTMQRDVAQYPWPHIARDRRKVDIHIGYQFSGATRPTKIQKTSISILPRAEWLNGSVVTLNGPATQSSIPIRASIPIPTATFNVALPMLGDLFYKVIGTADSLLNVVIDANYNPTTRQFTMVGSPKGSSWVPSVSFFGGANFNTQNTNKDGSKSDEFTALYRFERAPLSDNSDTIDSRELRLRSLSIATSSGGVLNVLKWVYTFKKTVEKLIKTASLVATGGIVSFHPSFVLKMKTQQISTVNIGTEERGSLMNIHEHKNVTTSTEPDEFPTSQAVGLTVIGGGQVEADLLGLIGLGVSYTQNYMFGSGSIFSSSIAARKRQYYPTALDLSSWLNLELNLLFGLVNIELFAGRLTHDYEKNIMPSFEVFGESWGGLFKSSVMRPKGEDIQVVQPLARIYDETPFYRPAPSIAANEHAMVTVHTEQSLLGGTGRIVLSTLDRSTHSLRSEVAIADNRNGIHDATATLVGNGGSALVAWVENAVGATGTYRNESLSSLMFGENIHMAYYDAINRQVVRLPIVSVDSGSIDAMPVVSVSDDSSRALVVWSSLSATSVGSDIYFRRLYRDGSTWRYEGTDSSLLSTPGYDLNLSVVPMSDGSFLVGWTNEDLETGAERVVSAVVSDSVVVTNGVVTTSDQAPIVSNMKMVGNGTMAVMLVSRSTSGENVQYNRSLEMYRYQDGTWSSPQQIMVGSGNSVFRHLKADMRKDGTFFAMIDAVEFDPDGKESHKILACVGSSTSSPSEWHFFENDANIGSFERSIWSMCAAIGPDSTLYVATQELDSIRGNTQIYGNGLQLGPDRCNAVVRAFRLDGRDKIESVKFGNTPTSTKESVFDELERVARYRIKVVDPVPNPAREAATISLIVQKPTAIRVQLVDNLGNHVATVFSGVLSEGIQGIAFETSGISTGRYSVVVSDDLGVAGSVPLVIVR